MTVFPALAVAVGAAFYCTRIASKESDMTADEVAAAVAKRMRDAEGAHVGTGLSLVEARQGYAKVCLAVGEEMLNSHGSVHGGVIFTVADTAFAYACNSRNEAAVAQQVSIIFVSPGRPGEVLVAEAVEQTLKGRTGVYAVTVTGGDARVVAVFQGLARKIGGKVVEAFPAVMA